MTFDELLKPVREDIDKVDSELQPLLVKRMECSRRVAEIKQNYGIPVLNVKREQEILDNIKNTFGDNGDSLAAIYSSIMAVSRESQHKLLAGENKFAELFDGSPKNIDLRSARVICQGVEGAYSNTAANKFFGDDADTKFVPAFADVFEAIKTGKGDFGVVPVENSAAGSVSEVYGLIMTYKFYIVGAVNVYVNHCLCSKNGAMPKIVYSHPQALLQCTDYIKNNRMEKREFSNTAAAAKFVSECEDGTIGAICSATAAEKYGLKVVEKGIQDSKNNHTRFAVVSSKPVFSDDADKISLSFTIPNITGSLYRVLERFSLNGLNLTKIESRPIKNSDFEYEFYLDFTGNVHNKNVQSLLQSLSRELTSISFLGNYKEK